MNLTQLEMAVCSFKIWAIVAVCTIAAAVLGFGLAWIGNIPTWYPLGPITLPAALDPQMGEAYASLVIGIIDTNTNIMLGCIAAVAILIRDIIEKESKVALPILSALRPLFLVCIISSVSCVYFGNLAKGNLALQMQHAGSFNAGCVQVSRICHV